jgi:hypothetical protein
MAGRIEKRLRWLDPERDHQEIVRLSYAYEFPWETLRALEFALFRTFAAPSIAGLLDATGEFARLTQKRYDDTAILIAEFCHHGYDSDRGRRAIRTMNRIHSRYQIANDDYRYVLSTFVCEVPRWINRFGWRRHTEIETQANFHFWRRVGQRMGIRELPVTYAEMVVFNRAYERSCFQYSEANARVASVTRDLLVRRVLPEPLLPLGRMAVHALLDEPLLDAFGFPSAPRLIQRTMAGALRARALVRRLLPRSEQGQLVQEQDWPTYPNGYVIEELGPEETARDESSSTALH